MQQQFLTLTPRYAFDAKSYAYWDNFLTEKEIDKLLANDIWLSSRAAEVGMGGEPQIDTAIRNSTCAWLGCDDNTKFFWDKITEVIAQVNRRYFHYDLSGLYEPAQLTIYTGSGKDHYSCHVDSAENSDTVPRKLSMSLLLSDTNDFSGGNLEIFPDSLTPVKLEQKRGRAWFFPSYTLHRITPVTKGIRRSLVLWIGGPAFK
ncbi:MAG: hypothetical protein EBR82_48915 [Caulobacteraceae bacterium]|nr:hypothetical protein [Caulobacteraceae bacterium]